MIAYLEGELSRNNIDYIVLFTNGIGYKIYLPSSVQQGLPQLGSQIELHIHQNVREDDISLYGFAKVEDLELFEELLNVSKIGPKVALSILSTMSSREFKRAIINNEISTLKEIKGIGNKTAKRLILELQEKIDLDNIIEDDSSEMTNNRVDDAIQALVALGYKRSNVYNLVKDICQDKDDYQVEDIIKEALIHLS